MHSTVALTNRFSERIGVQLAVFVQRTRIDVGAELVDGAGQ